MMRSTSLRLGTRPSQLAVAQAQIAADAIVAAEVARHVELVLIETHGDRLSKREPRGRWALSDGQFTSALEAALVDRRVDAVVHSFKDLPTASDPELAVAAVLKRGDPRDCLMTHGGRGLDDVPFGGRVGTSSPRRAAQLASARPDIVAAPIRGNVDTRLERARRREYDGVLLAASGIARLGVSIPAAAYLPLDLVLPAPAQAALAVQVRRSEGTLLAALHSAIDDRASRLAADVERTLLRRLGGGCMLPLGALAEVDGDSLRLRAAFEDPGGELLRVDVHGAVSDAHGLVERAVAGLAGDRVASA